MKSTTSSLLAVIACASSLLCIGQAAAQDAAPSQMDQLDALLGDGTCAGKLMALKGGVSREAA